MKRTYRIIFFRSVYPWTSLLIAFVVLLGTIAYGPIIAKHAAGDAPPSALSAAPPEACDNLAVTPSGAEQAFLITAPQCLVDDRTGLPTLQVLEAPGDAVPPANAARAGADREVDVERTAARMSAFYAALPSFLLWFFSFTLLAILMTAGLSGVLRVLFRAIAARWSWSLRGWLEEERRKSDAREPKAGQHILVWSEVISFLEAQNFSSIVARAQRMQMTEYLTVGPFESTRVAISRIRELVELLYAAKGAIELAGPAYDAAREQQKVFEDEQRAIRRFITRLELHAAVFRVLETLKSALVTLLPLAGFWVVASAFANSAQLEAPPVIGPIVAELRAMGGSTDVVAAEFETWRYDALAAQLLQALLFAFAAFFMMRVLIVVFDLLSYFARAAFRGRGVIATAVSVVMVAIGATFLAGAADGGALLDLTVYTDTEAAKSYLFLTLEILGLLAVPSADLSAFVPEMSPGRLLAIRLFATFVVTSLFLMAVAFIADQYEYGVQNRVAGGLTIPPELIKLGGGFLSFVLVTAMIYASVLEFANRSAADTQTLTRQVVQIPGGAPAAGDVGDAGEVGNAGEIGGAAAVGGGAAAGGGARVVITSAEDGEGGATVTQFVPYSVFLAVVGALLTLATRDLLENYFSGIAIRVDSPFEQGDRVTIDDGPMSEVRRIGIRGARLYEISTNSEIVMSHRQLTNSVIKNYSQPTLDYRRPIEFVYVEGPSQSLLSGQTAQTGAPAPAAAPFAFDPSGDPALSEVLQAYNGVPARAEALLLLLAMMTQGVRRPKIARLGFFNGSDDIGLEQALRDGRVPVFERTGAENRLAAAIGSVAGPRYGRILDGGGLGARWTSAQDVEAAAVLERAPAVPIGEAAAPSAIWTALLELDDALEGKFFRELFVHEVVDVLDTLEKSLPRNPQDAKDQVEKRRFENIAQDIRDRVYEIAVLTAVFDELLTNDAQIQGRFGQIQAIRGRALPHAFIRDGGRVAVRISTAYAEISSLFWDLRDIDLTMITKSVSRQLDRASVSLLDPPRVFSERLVSEDATPYYRVRLDVTLKTAEQSDEMIHHITTLAAMYQARVALA